MYLALVSFILLLVKILFNKLYGGIFFILIGIYFYNIGTVSKNIALNRLYDISFALIGIYFYNIGTDGKTIVE